MRQRAPLVSSPVDILKSGVSYADRVCCRLMVFEQVSQMLKDSVEVIFKSHDPEIHPPKGPTPNIVVKRFTTLEPFFQVYGISPTLPAERDEQFLKGMYSAFHISLLLQLRP
jgi:hypothetical protein